ncbi:hypothetical protein TNCT_164061 [Trichonephila clavata]|uniref:Uncharacterized protein n=1 Tax=Trichonephila clavata TaxID=2740835 RepID=A0A8X6IGN8_TRICU|nr:hypothetical protein TNCT_164061 [Trichonephila clavata]
MFRGARKEEFILIADELGEIINPEINNCNDEFGKITLSSTFGENVEAKLIKTSITLDNNSLNHPMDCLVAITDKLNAETLKPPSLYLWSINDKTNKKENYTFSESVDSFTPFSNDENDAESGNEIFYVESDSDNLNFNSGYNKIKDEQNNCDSLEKSAADYLQEMKIKMEKADESASLSAAQKQIVMVITSTRGHPDPLKTFSKSLRNVSQVCPSYC